MQFKRFRENINMKRHLSFLLVFLYAAVAHGDLDWGGGVTRFTGESGEVLDLESGCAVLISVRSGQLIDFEKFVPDQPGDLVTAGTILSDGSNVNRVLAVSCAFHSGYLLNSAVPDLLIDEQEILGVTSGEALFIIVWDTTTFESDLPTDDSYFTVLPLYFEGDPSSDQAQTSGGVFSVFTNRVHPDQSLDSRWLQLIAKYGGFNTYANFEEWVESIHAVANGELAAAKSVDSNGNGRSNIEEYAFDSPLSVTRMLEAGSEEPGLGGRSNVEGCELAVKLRGNDSQLAYALHVSDDLQSWRTVRVEYTNQQWVCADPEVNITESVYEGLGVWRLGLLVDAIHHASFFKFSSAIN
jgi:hypothetical protein